MFGNSWDDGPLHKRAIQVFSINGCAVRLGTPYLFENKYSKEPNLNEISNFVCEKTEF